MGRFQHFFAGYFFWQTPFCRKLCPFILLLCKIFTQKYADINRKYTWQNSVNASIKNTKYPT